jgi:hypothetical protein
MHAFGNDELISLLCVSAYNAYLGSFGGHDAAIRRHRWFTDPQPGDLVMETSTIYAKSQYDNIRIGFLKSTAREPVYTPEEWDGDDEPIPTEKVWYIEALFDGEVKRWTNADFIRVVKDRDQMRLLGF